MSTSTLTGKILRTGLGDVYSRSGHPLDQCPVAALDPISSFSGYQVYANDFVKWEGPTTGVTVSTGGWLCADTGTGVVGGQAAGDGYGVLSIASGGTENDCTMLQLMGESFKYVVGKRLWCFARLTGSDDADDNECTFGLHSVATTATDTYAETIALPDGIFFDKDETNEEWNFRTQKNSVATTSTYCTSTFADGVFRILGFYVDPSGDVTAYEGTTLDNLAVIATVNTGTATIPDDVELSLTFSAQAGATAANITLVDWVFVAQER